MEKKNWWLVFGVLTLVLAACAPATQQAAGVQQDLPAAAADVRASEASAVRRSPADKSAGKAKAGLQVLTDVGVASDQARIPEEPSTTPRSTRTPSPTARPTRTPTRTPLPAVTATTQPAATSTASPTPTQTAVGVGTASTATLTDTVPTPTFTPTPEVPPTPVPTLTAAANKDVVHFLLLGLDHGRNVKVELTDVMIVAVVNKETAQVSLLSIPRDLWVYIPTYGYSRINMAHKLGYLNDYPGGGPALLAETIRINLGIPIDHWARIDFEGFAAAVDELGGVDLIVACPVDLQYRSTDSGESVVLEPGEYHLDGATALRYVRTRRDGTDFDRARRQHQFLREVWEQMREPGLALKIPGLWSALKGKFETDLKLGDVLSLAPLALELKPQNVRSRFIAYKQTVDWTTDKGWRVLLPKPDEIRKVVDSLYAPPSAAASQEQAVRVAIDNGTWRDQMALVAADRLRWEGFDVIETGLAAERGQARTQIVVYRDNEAAVKQLMSLLRVKAKDVVYQPDAGAEADVRVVLGADYDPCR